MKKGKKQSKSKQASKKYPPPPAKPIQKSKISRGAKIAWTMIVGLGTLLAYLVLFPRISVVPYSPNLNPSEPFLTPFIISNDGYFSIYAIRYNCGINRVELDGGLVFRNSLVTDFIPLRAQLSPTEKDSFLCSFRNAIKGRTVQMADVTLEIEFQNMFGFRQYQPYRMVAEKAVDGQFHWLPQSAK
jgi:hypothetical protein